MTKEIKKTKRKKIASLDKRKARSGWFFVLPFIIGFVFIYLPIIIDSIKFSFVETAISKTGGLILTPVGWDNYQEALFVNPNYVQVLLQGMQNMIMEIPMILIFSLFMAVLLNQKMAGRAAFRAIFFIPVILSTGIMELVDSKGAAMGDYMGSTEGIDDGSGQSAASEIVSVMDFEALFSGMVVGQGLVEYVVTAINNIFNIVNRSGVQMLIFLAGLQSISPAIYESVQIDGASAWETFWKITFPMISPMILVNAVYTIIDSFTTSKNVVMSFINRIYNDPVNGGQVVASAMSWMYFLVVILVIAAVAGLLSAYTFYQRRD